MKKSSESPSGNLENHSWWWLKGMTWSCLRVQAVLEIKVGHTKYWILLYWNFCLTYCIFMCTFQQITSPFSNQKCVVAHDFSSALYFPVSRRYTKHLVSFRTAVFPNNLVTPLYHPETVSTPPWNQYSSEFVCILLYARIRLHSLPPLDFQGHSTDYHPFPPDSTLESPKSFRLNFLHKM